MASSGLVAFVLMIAGTFIAARFLGPVAARTMGSSAAAAADKRFVGSAVPSFSLTDQEGRTVTDQTLSGHVWIGSFILSSCAGSCPMTSAKMARLQRAIQDPRVKLVSFTMNPERDSPSVLKEYAGKINADPNRWHLLTGQRADAVRIAEGIGMAAQLRQRPEDIVHSEKLVLVDATGRTREYYDLNQEGVLDHLAQDAMALCDEVNH